MPSPNMEDLISFFKNHKYSFSPAIENKMKEIAISDSDSQTFTDYLNRLISEGEFSTTETIRLRRIMQFDGKRLNEFYCGIFRRCWSTRVERQRAGN